MRSPSLFLILGSSFLWAACGGGDESQAAGKQENAPAASQPAAGGETQPAGENEAPSQPAASSSGSAGAASVNVDRSSVLLNFGNDPDVKKVRNRLTDDRVSLGRELFHDKRLSPDGQVSCSTCHELDHYGIDGKKTSITAGGVPGKRNTPTVFNAFREFRQFWDGRAETVEMEKMEAGGPHGLQDDDALVATVKGIPEYADQFKAAFHDKDPITAENIHLALGAFQRKLSTRSPFDDYLDGDDNALTAEQKRGLNTFMSVKCTTCHITRLVGGGMFQKFGLVKPIQTADKGRFEVTGKPGDTDIFKVPQLLNVAETAPYYHDGSVDNLPEVVRQMADHQLGVQLNDQQVTEIVAFLGALTGKPTWLDDPAVTGEKKK